MKRAKFLIVLLSFLVLSSFAVQNTSPRNPSSQNNAGTGQSAPSSSPQAAPAQGASTQAPTQGVPAQMFGFNDFSKQYKVDQQFLAGPNAERAEQHLKILTAKPHIAGSPEDWATAQHVAKHFNINGLETEIVKYSVWMNRPSEISVSVTAPPT